MLLLTALDDVLVDVLDELEVDDLEEEEKELETVGTVPLSSSRRRLKSTAACPRVRGSSGAKCALSIPLMIPSEYISPMASSA